MWDEVAIMEIQQPQVAKVTLYPLVPLEVGEVVVGVMVVAAVVVVLLQVTVAVMVVLLVVAVVEQVDTAVQLAVVTGVLI
jgi:hypothetical protein